MKTPCLLLVFSFCACFVHAQTYFAPIGTKWYNSRAQFGPTPPNPDYAVFTVVDTAVIQGKHCVKIQGGADCLKIYGSVYLYQENHRVFFTQDSAQPFLPLYNFNAGVGQKFTTFQLGGQASAAFKVTAIDSVTVGLQTFRIQHIELDSGYAFLGFQVVEFVGGWTLFPQSGVCDPELGPVFCYNNGTFGYPEFPCGLVSTVEAGKQLDVQIMPNPGNDYFDLQVNEWPANVLTVQVGNLQGKTVFSQHVVPASSTRLRLDAHDWPAGLYFLKIGPQLSRKLIVQH